MTIAKGVSVRLKTPVIEGKVTGRRFNDSADSMEYCVPYAGADSEQHERWFLEKDLELTAEPVAEEGEPE